jgi:DNA-binding LytR/AlgR family response regulator
MTDMNQNIGQATAIIADDERLMRELLRSRLGKTWAELNIVAEAKNGQEAVDLVKQHEPDFVFLDIRMPGMTGIEAAREIVDAEVKTQVVFVTAYDEYAVQAFEQGAVDYVLKPAEEERLSVTVERLKGKLKSPPTDVTELSAILAKLSRGNAAPAASYLRFIQANIGQTLRMIDVDEVIFFQSDEKYTRVQLREGEALIRKPIKELIDELDPNAFWQIHRSTLVAAKEIGTVSRDFRGRLIIALKNHSQKLEVSRSYTHLFKGM